MNTTAAELTPTARHYAEEYAHLMYGAEGVIISFDEIPIELEEWVTHRICAYVWGARVWTGKGQLDISEIYDSEGWHFVPVRIPGPSSS